MNINNKLFSHLGNSGIIIISKDSLMKILVEEDIDTTTIADILRKVSLAQAKGDIALKTLSQDVDLTIDHGLRVSLDTGKHKNAGTIDPGLGIIINKQLDLDDL